MKNFSWFFLWSVGMNRHSDVEKWCESIAVILCARVAPRTHMAAQSVPPTLPDGAYLSCLVLLVQCNSFDQPAAADEALELPRPSAGGSVFSQQYRVVSRD